MDSMRHLFTKSLGRLSYGTSDLRGDVFGGITSGFLLLPLAMGYGVISGLGLVAGLYGSIVVCFFAAAFGGVRGMISGPNIFAAVVIAGVVAESSGSVAEAMAVTILAGLMHIAFGALRFGRYISYVPYTLVAGFYIATGILMIVMQVLPALGLPQAEGGVVGNVRTWPLAMPDANFDAAAVLGITLAVGAICSGRFSRLIPPEIAMLAVGTLVGMLWFHDAPVVGQIHFGLPSLLLSTLSFGLLLKSLEPAFTIAFLTSIITLVTARRTDGITGAYHKPNQEIVSHGFGNIVVGLIGGLPGSASVVSFSNVNRGGRTRVSGILAALVLLLLAVVISQIGQGIPFSVLYAVIMLTAWNLIEWRLLANIHRIPRLYAFVTLITVIVAVSFGYTAAILIGLVVSAMTRARNLESLEVGQLISTPMLDRMILGEEQMDGSGDPFEARSGLVVFPDQVSVASARELTRIVGRDVEGHYIVIFDFSRTEHMDDTASSMIGELISTVTARKAKRLVITGLHGNVADLLNSMNSLASVPNENFAADMEEAKQIIGSLLLQG